MSIQGQIPALEIFLGLLGFGFTILFCTAFCRVCQRFRDDRLEREEWLRAREADRPTSVFVIPVQASRPRLASVREELPGRGPPRYSVTVASGPPPAYNELYFKPEDLPPGYTEHSPVPGYSLPSSPTSLSPTSLGPTARGPTSLSPTSLGPTALGPTSRSPTSLGPTALGPTSLSPTSLSPTALGPTSRSPTSLGPTALGPTSRSPTSRSPTSPNMGPNQTEVFTAANVARE